MAGMIPVCLRVGTTAALLTFFEFLLSTIAVLSARAAIHGVFLFNLHRGGNAPLDARTRARRSIQKEALSFLLSVLLILGVALVEASLETGVHIENSVVDSRKCISMHAFLFKERILQQRPPFQVSVETWTIQTAERLNCPHGIRTLGLTAYTDHSGEKVNMTAPTCMEKPVPLSRVHIRMTKVVVKKNYLAVSDSNSSALILPQDSSLLSLGRETTFSKWSTDEMLDCGKLGISNYQLGAPNGFETKWFHVTNITMEVHQYLCRIHGRTPEHVLDVERLKRCGLEDPAIGTSDKKRSIKDFNSIRLDCLEEVAKAGEKFQLSLKNFSALFVNNNREQDYCCFDATLVVDYLFIDPKFIASIYDRKGFASPRRPSKPILLPTRISARDGFCQRTIAVLAQGALFYTIETEWRNSELNTLPRNARFNAYMMTVASSSFPLDQLPAPERSTEEDGSCLLRPVRNMTFVPITWGLILLFIGLSLVVVVVTVALVFRCFFTGESWRVGSARWSLGHLLGSDEGQLSAMIELVEVAEEDIAEADSRLTDSGGSPAARRPLDREVRNNAYHYRLTRMGGRSLSRRRNSIQEP